MKFKLVEDSKYKMGPLLKDLLMSFMGDTKVSYRGQTALKMYLCINRGVPYSKDIDVHHIDCDHTNYKDDNLALVKHTDHLNMHKECRRKILENIRDEVYQGGPGLIELTDLNPNIDSVVRQEYIKLLKQKLPKIRVD